MADKNKRFGSDVQRVNGTGDASAEVSNQNRDETVEATVNSDSATIEAEQQVADRQGPLPQTNTAGRSY